MKQGIIKAGTKAESFLVYVKNAATVSIAKGAPVCYYMSGTNDGFAVKRPSDMQAGAADNCFVGIAAENMAVGAQNKAVLVYGMSPSAVTISRGTKSASGTDAAVASLASAQIGAPIALDTVNNCFVAIASVGAATGYAVKGFVCTTLAQVSAIAATDMASTDTAWNAWAGTVLTTTGKIFLRNM